MRVSCWSSLILVAVGVGCGGIAIDPIKSDPTMVAVARPEPRDVTDYEEFTGHTDAILSVQIKARVTGYLLKKDFQDGQDVKAGDVLYEIDARPYKTALDSAEAMVAQGEAHKTRLAADYVRASNLFQKAVIGKQEFDLISSNLAEADAQLGASKAQLENARLNMSFTQVRAPMAGQLSRTLVDPGNLIRQDSTILNDIVSTEELYVYFDISTDAMERVSQVIEQGRVGGIDNKKVKVVVGTSLDADRYEDDMRGLRDIGEEIKLLEGRKKKLPAEAEAEVKKLASDAEAQMKKTADAQRASGEKVASDVDAIKAKLAADVEGRKKKLEADIADNDRARGSKRTLLAAREKDVHPEFPYDGEVNFSENKLDAATGTLRVRGVIKNPAPASILSPGLFVRVRLPIGEAHRALLVAEDAIGSDQGRSFVYVVTPKDEVEYRPIELGGLFEGKVGRKLRVIRKGIEDGERFIQDSETIRRVRPGAKVKVDMQSVEVAAVPTLPPL